MNNGWLRKPLGELCEILDHKRKPVTKRDRVAGDYPYYGATGILDYVTDYLFDEPLVLVGEDGAKWGSGENTAFAVEGKCWVNNHAHVLKPLRKIILDNWLIHYLNHSDLSEYVSGLTVPKLNQGSLREIPVPLPPLPEQRRIVGILDEAFEGIAAAKANAESNVDNAGVIFESHLQSVFSRRGEGWVEKRLGELARIDYGYTESACAEVVGPKFLRITDIQENGVDWSSVPYCPIDAIDYTKYKLADGDIVFARTGATTGKSYLVVHPPEAVCASYLIRVQVNRAEVLPPFVNLFFQTPEYWDSIRSGVSGSAQGGFNATKLGELVIPFPDSTTEQQSIVTKLGALSTQTQRLESIYQHKVGAFEALKKSLLHQAFAGQL